MPIILFFTGLVIIAWVIYGINLLFSGESHFIHWISVCLGMYIFLKIVGFWCDLIFKKEDIEKKGLLMV